MSFDLLGRGREVSDRDPGNDQAHRRADQHVSRSLPVRTDEVAPRPDAVSQGSPHVRPAVKLLSADARDKVRKGTTSGSSTRRGGRCERGRRRRRPRSPSPSGLFKARAHGRTIAVSRSSRSSVSRCPRRRSSAPGVTRRSACARSRSSTSRRPPRRRHRVTVLEGELGENEELAQADPKRFYVPRLHRPPRLGRLATRRRRGRLGTRSRSSSRRVTVPPPQDPGGAPGSATNSPRARH